MNAPEGVERIKVNHYRFLDDIGAGYTKYVWKRLGKKPQSKGGVTVVEIVVGGIPYVGTAVCSHKDNFCRKTGRIIALGRALKKVQISPQKS